MLEFLPTVLTVILRGRCCHKVDVFSPVGFPVRQTVGWRQCYRKFVGCALTISACQGVKKAGWGGKCCAVTTKTPADLLVGAGGMGE